MEKLVKGHLESAKKESDKIAATLFPISFSLKINF
jgi:hypothetical protein